MELYRVGLPKAEDIIAKDKFIIDIIIPLCIKKISEDQFSILFFAEQQSTETSIFLQSIIAVTDDTDKGFLLNHHLNVDNIRKNPDRLNFYNEKISHMNGNIFNTDFDMDIYEENKLYFEAASVKALNTNSKEAKAFIMSLLIPRDNYIKISLFMTKFLLKDINAESVLISNKLKNIKFETMTHVKLDASSVDRSNGIVYNHYTMGAGPSIYKLNFLSPAKKNGKLRNPMIAYQYETFYINDFLVNDVLYDFHQDRILIIYEIRTKINNSYKETKVLILNKDLYDHTNFYDLYKVYEDKK